MRKLKVLFVCVHNSARSQMAEALLNKLAGSYFEAKSAGLEAGKLNSFAVEALKEEGIDISQNKTKKVFDLFKANEDFSYVITVCDETNSERCPIFPKVLKTYYWSFEDPASFQGSDEEKLEKTKEIKNQIKSKIELWLKELNISLS